MSVFLQQIVDDHKSGTKTENLGAFARRAYEQSLKNYHGWFVQKIFAVCLYLNIFVINCIQFVAHTNVHGRYYDLAVVIVILHPRHLKKWRTIIGKLKLWCFRHFLCIFRGLTEPTSHRNMVMTRIPDISQR